MDKMGCINSVPTVAKFSVIDNEAYNIQDGQTQSNESSFSTGIIY